MTRLEVGAVMAALIAVPWAVLGGLAWDLRRLPARLIARQARAFADQTATDLAFATITAHYEEPNP